MTGQSPAPSPTGPEPLSAASGQPILVIGNKRYSSWSLRPWLLLREAGVDFHEQRLALDSDAFREQIATWSPTRCVPVLHDGGEVIWDSLSICEYVNERWLEGRGWPADRSLRALARSAAAEMHSGFLSLRRQLPMNCARVPDGYRGDAEANADGERIQFLWSQLIDRSGGPFLGGSFGIVDAMYAPVAIRFRGYGVTLTEASEAYVSALYALPSLRHWFDEAAQETERLEKYESLRG